MSHKGPSNPTILELLRAYLSGKRSIGLVKHVLGRDLDFFAQMLTDQQEEEGWWGNHDFCMDIKTSQNEQ